MTRYLIRRLAEAIVTLFGVAVLVFIVMRVLPGDEITSRFGTEAGNLTEAQRAALERYYGLDQPLVGQFWSWLRSVFTGNFGISVTSGRPVSEQIRAALPVTIELAILATLIGSILGVAIGVMAASRPEPRPRRRRADVRAARTRHSQLRHRLGADRHPRLAVLVLPFGGDVQRVLRVAAHQPAAADLPGARARCRVGCGGDAHHQVRLPRGGLPGLRAHGQGQGPHRRRVRWRHVLHNSLVPIVTMIGIQFGYLLGGTVIVEEIFALPGMGRLVLTGITQREYAVVQSSVLVIAAMFVLVNLVVDLLYARIDPRVRLS